MVGFLARLWAVVRLKELVGKDRAGNTYYRQSRKVDGALTERRYVEYKGDSDPRTLPVEWSSWLMGRRKEAPTPEEIMALEAYRKRVKMNAAMVEKEEEKRRFRSKSLQQDVHTDETKPPEMNKFIEQVAALEGVNFDGGEGTFVDGAARKTTLIEQNGRPTNNDMPEKGDAEQDEQGALKRKERLDVYEKWVPPS